MTHEIMDAAGMENVMIRRVRRRVVGDARDFVCSFTLYEMDLL